MRIKASSTSILMLQRGTNRFYFFMGLCILIFTIGIIILLLNDPVGSLTMILGGMGLLFFFFGINGSQEDFKKINLLSVGSLLICLALLVSSYSEFQENKSVFAFLGVFTSIFLIVLIGIIWSLNKLDKRLWKKNRE